MHGADQNPLKKGLTLGREQMQTVAPVAELLVKRPGLTLGFANDPHGMIPGLGKRPHIPGNPRGLLIRAGEGPHLRLLPVALNGHQVGVRADLLGEPGDLPGGAVAFG